MDPPGFLLEGSPQKKTCSQWIRMVDLPIGKILLVELDRFLLQIQVDIDQCLVVQRLFTSCLAESKTSGTQSWL